MKSQAKIIVANLIIMFMLTGLLPVFGASVSVNNGLSSDIVTEHGAAVNVSLVYADATYAGTNCLRLFVSNPSAITEILKISDLSSLTNGNTNTSAENLLSGVYYKGQITTSAGSSYVKDVPIVFVGKNSSGTNALLWLPVENVNQNQYSDETCTTKLNAGDDGYVTFEKDGFYVTANITGTLYSQATYCEINTYDFPEGTVFIPTFELDNNGGWTQSYNHFGNDYIVYAKGSSTNAGPSTYLKSKVSGEYVVWGLSRKYASLDRNTSIKIDNTTYNFHAVTTAGNEGFVWERSSNGKTVTLSKDSYYSVQDVSTGLYGCLGMVALVPVNADLTDTTFENITAGGIIPLDSNLSFTGKGKELDMLFDSSFEKIAVPENPSEYEFLPFALNVITTGGVSPYKRLVVDISNATFNITDASQLIGCKLNGKMTYNGTGNYSEEVLFEDVEVVAATLSGTTARLDFAVPNGYTINLTHDEFVWNLTLNPKDKPLHDIPVTGNTFFLLPEQFKCYGTWSTETDGDFTVLTSGTGAVSNVAKAAVEIPEAGTYNVYSSVKGLVNSKLNDTVLNTSENRNDNYSWNKIGEVTVMENETITLSVSETSETGSYVRAYMFTTEDYVPGEEFLLQDFKEASVEVLKHFPIDENETTLVIKPSDFETDLGSWTVTNGFDTTFLYGGTSNDNSADATVKIKIPESGTYYVWGSARDYTSNSQGSRSFKLGIDGKTLSGKIGIHGAREETGDAGSFGWDLAGKIILNKGETTLSAVKIATQANPRLRYVVLTTDPYFDGIDEKNLAAAEQGYPAQTISGVMDLFAVKSYGNKLSFTLKNRTDEAEENILMVAAIYTKEGKMVDAKRQYVDSLSAYSGLGLTSFIFEATESWEYGKIFVWNADMNPLRKPYDFSYLPEDYVNPDEDVDADFGTVSDYNLDYTFANPLYANEYYVRNGIYNTLYKLQKGEDITIAYLGGSITEQNSWRGKTTAYFEDNYNGTVTEVNIGLSGTNADLGVCRLEKDVLSNNPDLVFIEYSVNGGEAKDVEGMIQKIRVNDPTTDVMFVYTATTSEYAYYKTGSTSTTTAIFDEVAAYYGIPSVFFARQAFDMYEQDLLTLSGTKEDGKVLWTQDTIHLTADGGFLAAGAIARCIKTMEENFDKSTYQLQIHVNPENNYCDNPWNAADYSDDWSKMKFEGTWLDCSLDTNGNFNNYEYTGGYLNQFKKLFPNMKGTTTAGSSVTVKFKGTDIGVFEAGGPYSGQLRVIVDGIEQTDKLVLYNQYYSSGLRHQYYFLPSMDNDEHTVTFILDHEMPDKSYLQAQNPTDTTYEKNELYLGKILLVGELLDANQ